MFLIINIFSGLKRNNNCLTFFLGSFGSFDFHLAVALVVGMTVSSSSGVFSLLIAVSQLVVAYYQTHSFYIIVLLDIRDFRIDALRLIYQQH